MRRYRRGGSRERRHKNQVSDARRPLRTISEIRSFFRTNARPIFFVGPTAFNLLGIDRWVRNFRLPRLLRLLGRRPSAGVHPEEQAVRRVREQRADQQLPTARSRGAGPHRLPGGVLGRGADDRDGVLRRGDRADLRGAGLRPDPPAGLAAPAPGLQDRDDSPRRGGGGTLGAQHHRTGRQPTTELAKLAADAGLGSDLVVQTPYGDSGKTTFFIKQERRLAARRREHGRRRAQGHEADQQPGRGRGGRQHPPRHRRGAVHDRSDRLSRAHSVQGGMVRQRPVPGGAERGAPGRRDRACPPARRPVAAGGLQGLFRGRCARRRRLRSGLPRASSTRGSQGRRR